MSLSNTLSLTINAVAQTFTHFRAITAKTANRFGSRYTGKYSATQLAELQTAVEEGRFNAFTHNTRLSVPLIVPHPTTSGATIATEAAVSFTVKVPQGGSVVEAKHIAKALTVWIDANIDSVLTKQV